MRVKIFHRDDGATVVLPLDLWGSMPAEFEGVLEVGDADLDMACLSTPFLTALGLKGYCVALGSDVAAVLSCITQWKEPFTFESIHHASAHGLRPDAHEHRSAPSGFTGEA
ncbi:hypothetical protein [Cognatilysobacter terrigena]|uniref:hypothetical protein n=1 Tax=Cognatilysobacter terrigena TaxID=2488749 RepID=UPI00105CC469|nr:hypothetical protein [Lysobacter terrigena]